jgi:hypothetical protein
MNFFLYHRVPKNMVGDILYPLNTLKTLLPEVYNEEVKKYKGRERIMEQVIPYFNCLWNDVLHFSPVPPREIKSALIEAGYTDEIILHAYKISPDFLEKDKTIVYLYRPKNRTYTLSKNDFIPFNPDAILEYAMLPLATKKYYKECIAKGGDPLLNHGVPHILYKGTISVADLSIIEG